MFVNGLFIDNLKKAALYVPHAVNQLSFHRCFSPQQWVLGKSMTYVHGLSGEFFNPAQFKPDGHKPPQLSFQQMLTPSCVENSPRSFRRGRKIS